MTDGVERHRTALRIVYIDLLQELGVLPKARRRFHHHVILIERRVHGGDLALAKRVIQHVVDELGGNPKARGGVAIVLNHGLQAAILLIGIDVGDQAEVPQGRKHGLAIFSQILDVIAAHGELIKRCAVASAYAHVLVGLHIVRGSANDVELRPQPLDYVVHRDLTFRQRLQLDLHARRVQRVSIPAAASGITGNRVHGRILPDDLHHLRSGSFPWLGRRCPDRR